MATDPPLNVLFICTGNSGRSILAEGILGAVGAGRFKAYSAGSHPVGAVNPLAIELLKKNHRSADHLRSKSWDEFTAPGSPELDYVVTVCEAVAGEISPVWPGQPVCAHWGMPDPAAVTGSEEERRKAFFTTYNQLFHRLMIFVSLPLDKLDRKTLKKRLEDIGRE